MSPAKITDKVSTEVPEGTDYLRPTPPPRGAAITIAAQDPSVRDRTTNRVLTSQVYVPADKMAAGPRTHRFHVVDYDTTAMHAEGPADLTDGYGNFVDRFGKDGKLRFHQRKGLAWDAADRDRQQRRLAYLVEEGIRDQRNRLGFSDGVPLGQRFNLLHLTDTDATESW
jgi:hypothetical protein